jgi:hypothetical protein
MTSIFAFFAHSILLMAIMLAVLQVRRWKQYWPIPYILAAVIMILPVANWLIIEFSRGYFSDISMATIIVCLVYIVSGMRPKAVTLDHSFKVFILTVCIILFPSSMGATQYDLFSLGFPSETGFNALVIGLSAVGLIAWYKKVYQLAIYVALVLISYSAGIYESKNIWVYMVDPIVMVLFIVGYLKLIIQIAYKFIKIRLVKNA